MNQSLLKSCNSWEDFQSALIGMSNTQKGHAFEDLVALYLQICPKDKTTFKSVWKIREDSIGKYRVPTTVRKKLNLPEPDLGIDLLAVTHDGEYYAIQCKYHSNIKDSVTKKETDSGMK